MAKYQLLLPKMGESVAEATIIKWVKNQGDHIEADDAVLEIATDKVDSEVPSPVTGTLVACLFKENEVVQVGAPIAIIEVEEEVKTIPVAEQPAPAVQTTNTAQQSSPAPVTAVQAAQEQPEPAVETIPGISQLSVSAETQQKSQFNNSARFYSPLVKNIAHHEKISVDELDKIPGTGTDGRLTKDDLLGYLKNNRQAPQSAAASNPEPAIQQPIKTTATEEAAVKEPVNTKENAIEPAQQQTPVTAPPSAQAQTTAGAAPASQPAVSVSGGDEIIEMDRMRRLIAEHMVMSVQTSPHVTSFVEADVTNLVQWRDKVKNSFEKREGEKITFTPMFIEAVARAIKDMPMVNVSVSGTQIIKRKDINIGMAAALPSGNLIVPVIRKADQLNLLGLTKAVNDLAGRARSNKLQPDEVKNGTFTITNVGSFGNVMGTPIINQPQVAILAVGAIKKKPAVIETSTGDMIAIRHMMFLSLSYDHRVVDGSLGGSFVKRVANYLENWDINREI